jgi:hypothetical protein
LRCKRRYTRHRWLRGDAKPDNCEQPTMTILTPADDLWGSKRGIGG